MSLRLPTNWTGGVTPGSTTLAVGAANINTTGKTFKSPFAGESTGEYLFSGLLLENGISVETRDINTGGHMTGCRQTD